MKLSLSGKICLEIRRHETEAPYIEHQARQLRAAATRELKLRMDLEPAKEHYRLPYSRLRLRVIGEDLRPAYNLLYPQDAFRLSGQVLTIAGLKGQACLWVDNGRRDGPRYLIKHRRYNESDYLELADYLISACEQPCQLIRQPAPGGPRVIVGVELLLNKSRKSPELFQRLRAFAHPTVRPLLRIESETCAVPRDPEIQERPMDSQLD
jgi:hypothetical protein